MLRLLDTTIPPLKVQRAPAPPYPLQSRAFKEQRSKRQCRRHASEYGRKPVKCKAAERVTVCHLEAFICFPLPRSEPAAEIEKLPTSTPAAAAAAAGPLAATATGTIGSSSTKAVFQNFWGKRAPAQYSRRAPAPGQQESFRLPESKYWKQHWTNASLLHFRLIPFHPTWHCRSSLHWTSESWGDMPH